MNLPEFSTRFAEEVNAKYTEYDDKTSVFVIRLRDSRFQNVLTRIIDLDDNKTIVQVTSKVCSLDTPINYEEVLSSINELIHTRFIIEDGFLKTEGAFFLNSLDEELIKEMILEVGETADKWEFKLTGKDIH